jgi:hypothetical protein
VPGAVARQVAGRRRRCCRAEFGPSRRRAPDDQRHLASCPPARQIDECHCRMPSRCCRRRRRHRRQTRRAGARRCRPPNCRHRRPWLRDTTRGGGADVRSAFPVVDKSDRREMGSGCGVRGLTGLRRLQMSHRSPLSVAASATSVPRARTAHTQHPQDRRTQCSLLTAVVVAEEAGLSTCRAARVPTAAGASPPAAAPRGASWPTR